MNVQLGDAVAVVTGSTADIDRAVSSNRRSVEAVPETVAVCACARGASCITGQLVPRTASISVPG